MMIVYIRFVLLILACVTSFSSFSRLVNSTASDVTNESTANSSSSPSEIQLVRYEHPLSDKDKRWIYYTDLLNEVLTRTASDYGPYELQRASIRTVASRTFQALSENKLVDVAWGVTSIDREQRLKPVRIPLLKGLLGYRIFIIRDGDQARFDAVRNIEHLKQIKAGQGHDWVDVKILEHNGLLVQTSTSYEALFTMLSGRRFDYFPRSVFEAFTEVDARPEMGLNVETKLMLQYVSPTFFFTNKQNSRLHKRISKGLWSMVIDGSFDEFFRNHPLTKELFSKVDFDKRMTYQLENPNLSEDTTATTEDKRLWFE